MTTKITNKNPAHLGALISASSLKDGKRLVGYDNERGKGDHKHIGEDELAYAFQNVDQLLEDFWNDVKRCDDD